MEISCSSSMASQRSDTSVMIGDIGEPHGSVIANSRLSAALHAIACVVRQALNYTSSEEEQRMPIIAYLVRVCKEDGVHNLPSSLLMALDHLTTLSRMSVSMKVKNCFEATSPAQVHDAVLVPQILTTALVDIASSPHMKIANPALISQCIAIKKSIVCSFFESSGLNRDNFPPAYDDELSNHRFLINLTKPSIRNAFWLKKINTCASGEAMLECLLAIRMELELLPNLLPLMAESPWVHTFLAKFFGHKSTASLPIDYEILAACCDILSLLLPHLKLEVLLQLNRMLPGLFLLLEPISDSKKNMHPFAFRDLASLTRSKSSRSNNYEVKQLRASIRHAQYRLFCLLHHHLILVRQMNGDLAAYGKEYVMLMIRFLGSFVKRPILAMQHCVTCRIQAKTISLLTDLVIQQDLFGQENCNLLWNEEETKLFKEVTNSLVDIISKPPHQPNLFLLKGGIREAAKMLLVISRRCHKIGLPLSVWCRPRSLETTRNSLGWLKKLLTDSEPVLRRTAWIILSNLSLVASRDGWDEYEYLFPEIDLLPLVNDAECPSIKGEIIWFASRAITHHAAKETKLDSFAELLRLLANYCRQSMCDRPHFFAAIYNLVSQPSEALNRTDIRPIMDSFYEEYMSSRDESTNFDVLNGYHKLENDEMELIRFFCFKAAEVDLLTYFCKFESMKSRPVSTNVLVLDPILHAICFLSRLLVQSVKKAANSIEEKQRAHRRRSMLSYFASCCCFLKERIQECQSNIFRTLDDVYQLIRACERVLSLLASVPSIVHLEHAMTLCGIFDVLVLAIPIVDGRKPQWKNNMASLLNALVTIYNSRWIELLTCGEAPKDGTCAMDNLKPSTLNGEKIEGLNMHPVLSQCLKEKCAILLALVLDVAAEKKINAFSDGSSKW
eukprot:CAMPEP_0116011838 /NCGR_PEP_ID=MMETSP0321-20121206/4791_1 /TAXON_ID=163516 /ORGANISM="Leptocylindrus danicus var. danicus, Strain B650" /LENGTH=897 /DNA_ID=CAMNT_0003481117 /DNA_START=205 /DNA_END=2895 /DNA_ORIENTATION=+